jgi:hypothetical protein
MGGRVNFKKHLKNNPRTPDFPSVRQRVTKRIKKSPAGTRVIALDTLNEWAMKS